MAARLPGDEYGGLVFVYIGPPDTEPLFPRFDIIYEERQHEPDDLEAQDGSARSRSTRSKPWRIRIPVS